MIKLAPGAAERLRALLDVCALELDYLKRTDARLFSRIIDETTIRGLTTDDDLSERVDAFVSRFGRLQDTLGDKLLPAFLAAREEKPGAMLENLDRAEKLGLVNSADTWLALRKLRNRMIHEYVRAPGEMASALTSAHEHVPLLEDAYSKIKHRLGALIGVE